jgi:signal transduction histidine kinase
LDRLAHLSGIERVQLRAETNMPRIFVDPMRIEQVLTNLVSNAIKYGDEHGKIIVQVEQREKEIRIAVTNHGRGIAPDEMPHVFNRFMRSKTTRGSGVQGLGLGLYITRGVVEAHGGRLWAESTPGETTTFHVALPISAEIREAA